MVLGLSLTPDDVVWVLVDEADGAVIDHDAVEIHTDTEIAGAAARGACAIATAGGHDIDRVRLTWSQDMRDDGLRLWKRLDCLGFRSVEAVPLSCAWAVLVDPDTEPALALAYGAALAKVSLAEAITVPITKQAVPVRPRRRVTRGRVAVAVSSAAAVAALAGLALTTGSTPQVAETAATVEPPSLPGGGWVAVPAAPAGIGDTVRKVVVTPEETEAPAPQPVWTAYPVAPEPAVAAAVAPVVVPLPVPVGVPHLPSGVPDPVAPPVAEPVIAPPVALAVAVPDPIAAGVPHLPAAPPPEMTDPANLFTALP